MHTLKKTFYFLLFGFLIFSVNPTALEDSLVMANDADDNLSSCSSKPHTYDFKFQTASSAIKTLSGEIDNVVQKKEGQLYNMAFMTTNFNEPQTKKIFFLLSKDNIEIEGNLVFTDHKNSEKMGSFIPHKKDQSNLQITYTMSNRKIKRISNSGNFKITNLKINEDASSLIVPVSFKLEFDGGFTCPENKFEQAQILSISGFTEVNPIEESLIAIR